jgi:hypothetical protein
MDYFSAGNVGRHCRNGVRRNSLHLRHQRLESTQEISHRGSSPPHFLKSVAFSLLTLRFDFFQKWEDVLEGSLQIVIGLL